MKLTAPVTRVVGKTRYFRSTLRDDALVRQEEVPMPARVEIVDEDGGYYLFHYDCTGEYLADDWFPTLRESKEHAKQQFGIEEGEWSACP